MVVRKAANMAKNLRIPLIGLVENMSYLICPECKNKIDLFGSSQAEVNARQIGIPFLGRIPLDTTLSILCDAGSIEDYRCDTFEVITNMVIAHVSLEDAISQQTPSIHK
jgi:hypothetical protein